MIRYLRYLWANRENDHGYLSYWSTKFWMGRTHAHGQD